MKCPYVVNIQQTNVNKYEYDEDGKQTIHNHRLVEVRTFVECVKEDCGAYQNSKCCYNE
jgi:hypothetical protein